MEDKKIVTAITLDQDQLTWLDDHVDKDHNRSSLIRCALSIFIKKYGDSLKIERTR